MRRNLRSWLLTLSLFFVVGGGCEKASPPPTTSSATDSSAQKLASDGVHQAVQAGWALSAGVECLVGCVERAETSTSATERVSLLRDACVLDHPGGCEGLGKALRFVHDPLDRDPKPLLSLESRIGALEDLEHQCKNGQYNLCAPVAGQLQDPIAGEIVARFGCEAGALGACRLHQHKFGHTDFDARGAIVEMCRSGDDRACRPLIREKDVDPSLLAYLNAQCALRGAFCREVAELAEDPERKTVLARRNCRTSYTCDVEFRPRRRGRFHERDASRGDETLALVNAECDSVSELASWRLFVADVSACGPLEKIWVQWIGGKPGKAPTVNIHGATQAQESCLRGPLERNRRIEYTQCYGELRTTIDEEMLEPVDADLLRAESKPDPGRPKLEDFADVGCPADHKQVEHPADEHEIVFGPTEAERDLGCYDTQGIRSGPTRIFDTEGRMVRISWYSDGEMSRDVRFGAHTLERTYTRHEVTVKTWDRDGVLLLKRTSPAKTGETKTEEFVYYPNGLVRSRTLSDNRIPYGKHEHWTLDGTLYENAYNAEGLPVGTWKVFHGNGQLGVEKHYDKDGLEQGVERRWDAAGTLRIEGTWKDAQRTGERQFFGPDGTLRRTETWDGEVLTGVAYD